MQETPSTAYEGSNHIAKCQASDYKPYELSFDSDSDIDFDKHFKNRKINLNEPKKIVSLFKSIVPEFSGVARQIKIRSRIPLSITDRKKGNPYEIQFDRMFFYKTTFHGPSNFLALRSAFQTWLAHPAQAFFIVKGSKIWQFTRENEKGKNVMIVPSSLTDQEKKESYYEKQILLRLQPMLEEFRNATNGQYEIYSKFLFEGCKAYTPSGDTTMKKEQRITGKLRGNYDCSFLESLRRMRVGKEFELRVHGMIWRGQVVEMGDWMQRNGIEFQMQIMRNKKR